MSVLDTFTREDKKPIPFMILLYLGILLEPVNPKFAWFKFSITLNSLPPAVSKISTDFTFLWISEEIGSTLPKYLKNSMPLNEKDPFVGSEPTSSWSFITQSTDLSIKTPFDLLLF